jgi:hypothetical protein
MCRDGTLEIRTVFIRSCGLSVDHVFKYERDYQLDRAISLAPLLVVTIFEHSA